MIGHIEFGGQPILMELSVVVKEGLSFHRDALELLFVLDGDVKVRKDFEEIKLGDGNLAVIDAGILHSVTAIGRPATIISLYFDLSHYQKGIPHMRGISFTLQPDESNPETRRICGAIRNYIIRLFSVRLRNVPMWQDVYAGIGDIMLALLIKWLTNTNFLKVPLASLKDSDKERLYSIIAHISSNYQRRHLIIKDIADDLSISTSRILHFWKEVINIPLHDGILMNRVYETARLLQESDMSITEISDICGFSSEKYLYQHFKAHYKMTPNEFRQSIALSRLEENDSRPLDIHRDGDEIIDHMRNYFMKIDDYSFLGIDERLLNSETNIFKLYNFVSEVDEAAMGELQRGHEYGYLSADKDKVLIERDGEYRVNWEYMFNYVYWYFRIGFKVVFIIKFHLMGIDQWERIVASIWDVILARLGEPAYQLTEWSIEVTNVEDLRGAILLADKLGCRKGFNRVTTMLMI